MIFPGVIRSALNAALAILLLVSGGTVLAQDSVQPARQRQQIYRPYSILDSVTRAREQAYEDSLQKIRDSLNMGLVRAPDPRRKNLFIDSLVKFYTVENLDFRAWASRIGQKPKPFREGTPKQYRELWVIAIIMALIVFFAVVKMYFSKQLLTIVQSFYSNRILSQISKEDTVFNSWPFIFLYMLFGLTIGMFLYLSGKYYGLVYEYSGFEWFLVLSGTVIGLFTLKVLLLRVLGFLFGLQKMVRDYISVLYLSYFNAAILFLPLVFAYSLSPYKYAPVYSYVAIALLFFIFVTQFFRVGANILSSYRFSKFYLFIYLCALEFCPVLILVKVLGF